MKLTKQQIYDYNNTGFLLLKSFFSHEKIAKINNESENLPKKASPEVFLEKETQAIRTIFAPEKFSQRINKLINLNRLVIPIKQLLKEDFYLFQSKFNSKASFESGSWHWHQDFTFWKDDGMPAPKALTIAIYLSDITEFSGPILLVPGSHNENEIKNTLVNPDGVHDENLKYVISKETVKEISQKHGGIVSSAAPQGSILIFHSCLLHGSSQNLYYEDRNILMFTYNPISNKTIPVKNPREEFMVKTDFTSIT